MGCSIETGSIYVKRRRASPAQSAARHHRCPEQRSSLLMTAPQDPALPAGLLHSLRDLLTQPDEPLPPGDVREVAVDALGLIGLGALVMLAITVLAVPRASGAVIAVSALFVVLPLLLRSRSSAVSAC